MTIERAENTPAVRPQAPAKVPVPLARPLADLDQAWRAAGILARARLLPEGLYANNPEQTQANVTTILWYGAELGLAPMQAIQSIYVVNGKPQMSGQLWLAKVREAGHRVENVEHTNERCTIRITRGDTGEQWTETFTIEDARNAGLLGKGVWKSWPKRMLQWRAVANCATSICPEVALGYGLQGDEPDEVETTATALAEAVDARTAQEERPAAEPDDDVQDADVVEDPEQSDEEIREELLDLAREHQAEEADPEDPWAGIPVAEPGSWGGDE